MSEETYFCNLPGLMMTRHALEEGVIEVEEGPGAVKLEIWNGNTSHMYLRGRDDAAVLRYVADCLDSFAERPEEAEEAEEPEAENNLAKSLPSLDQGSAKKQPQIVVGGSDSLNEFALK